ncbi:unnamed protein product [Amoebophrya sp. A25]|nr:unnamed protein product [Amoebophrya sp. A25]|eukprot:GSA25T00022752001.1
MSASCDFVLLGASGFIGGHILTALEEQNYSVVVCKLRLEQPESLERFLRDEHTPKLGVICAAGSKGTPNIDWCLEHTTETIEANILGQLNVVRVCRVLGLHCTLIGSGMVYPPLPSDRAAALDFYEEDRDKILARDYIDGDIPDASGKTFRVRVGARQSPTSATADKSSATYKTENVHFYRKARCMLEDLLQYYPDVLNLRTQFPVAMTDKNFENKASLLAKLKGFPKVDAALRHESMIKILVNVVRVAKKKYFVDENRDINHEYICCKESPLRLVFIPIFIPVVFTSLRSTVSVTFLENLCPGIPIMVKQRASGNINFVNPGAVKYADVVERLRKKFPGTYDPELREAAQGRGSILMSAEKMVNLMAASKGQGDEKRVPSHKILTCDECLDIAFGDS